jgi:hypothetical protein
VISGYRSPGFTISNHTSLNPVSQFSFCVLGSIAAVLIAYSLLFYIAHRWELGKIYRALAVLVSAAFFVACLFPNDPNAYTMHDYSSWVAMYSEFALAIFLILRLWPRYNLGHKVLNIFVILLMLALFVAQLVNFGFFRSYVLIFESSFILSIFALMLSLILGRPRRRKQPDSIYSTRSYLR